MNRTELTKNCTQNRISKSAGFSMLEVILVLGFMGIVMAAVGTWYRKHIDEKRRDLAADAIAQEVAGLLQFINDDTISAQLTVQGTAVQNQDASVVNPLYQLPDQSAYPGQPAGQQNPLFTIHHQRDLAWSTSSNWSNKPLSPYMARTFMVGQGVAIENLAFSPTATGRVYNQPLKWSERLWGTASVRDFFTDSSCQHGAGTTTTILFKQQYLTCRENPTLQNSDIAISRIDLISEHGSRKLLANTPQHTAVDRVEVYVSFTPADHNIGHLHNYVTPLLDAFKNHKIQPDTSRIHLVRRLPGTGDEQLKWELLDKTGNNVLSPVQLATGSDPATYMDLPEMGSILADKTGQRVYGLRFIFNGKGDYLRTDGSNAASKVCWNTQTGTAGPCIIAESEELLAVKTRDNQRYASLHAASIVLDATRSNDDTHQVDEQYTAPRIQYKRFAEQGIPPAPVYQNPNDATQLCEETANGQETCGVDRNTAHVTLPEHGAISLPVQSCPQVQDAQNNPVEMHPRLSVAVSSVASGLVKDDNNIVQTPGAHDDVFASQYSAINQLSNRGGDQRNPDRHSRLSVNRLGGVVFQIVEVNDDDGAPVWHIAALMNVEDTDGAGRNWQIYNPPWLSVLVTSWCSSEPQP